MWGEKDSSSTFEEELNNLGQDSYFVVGHDFKIYKESVWRRGLDIRERQLGSNEQILEKIYAAFGFKVFQISFDLFWVFHLFVLLIKMAVLAFVRMCKYTTLAGSCFNYDNLCDFQ